MRLVIGRVVAALVLLAGAGYLLQASAGGRDHDSIHRQVVPFGRSTLELPILLYLYIHTHQGSSTPRPPQPCNARVIAWP